MNVAEFVVHTDTNSKKAVRVAEQKIKGVKK